VASVYRYFNAASERQLALQFQVGAIGRSSNCPTGDDFGSWLVLMQHYGLPTRLLDWTRSLIVAAYFAVLHEPVDGDGAIWVLAPERLNLLVPVPVEGICILNGQSSPPQIRSLTEGAFRDVPCRSEPYAVPISGSRHAVLVQSGAFTIHASGAPLDEHPGAPEFLARFDIPRASRAAFQEELAAMGARRSLLFPALRNLARELATKKNQNFKITERQL
jgi:hypothetical protein